MKKSIKIIMLCMVLAVLALAIAACTGNGGGTPVATPTPTPADPTPTPAPTPEPTPTPEPEAAAPDFPDLGGRVVTMAGTPASIQQFLGRFSDDDGFIEPDPMADDYNIRRRQWDNRLRVEEAFNITIEARTIAAFSSIDRVRMATMAGEVYADFIGDDPWGIFTCMINDYLVPFEGLTAMLPGDLALDVLTTQLNAWPQITFHGETFALGVPRFAFNPWGILINLDVIESVGAPNPVTLYENGEWTWEALRNIIEMSTQDLTGDGNMDIFGLAGGLNELLRHMIVANGEWLADPYTFELGLTTPAGMMAVEFVYDILRNGWWIPADPEHNHPTLHSSININLFADGRFALAVGAVGAINGTRDLGAEFALDWVPFPVGPMNNDNYVMDIWPVTPVGIVDGAEDPHYLLWILDELWAWAEGERYEFHLEATFDNLRGFAPTEATVQRVIRTVLENSRMEYASIANLINPFLRDIQTEWWNGTMTPAQSIEHFGPARVEHIRNYFGMETEE